MKTLDTLVLFVCAIILQIRFSAQQNPPHCGIRQLNSSQLILLGGDTVHGDWPWHVAVYHRTRRSNDYACGGTIINDQFVLTAAHCVMNSDSGYQLVPSRIFVRMGIHNLDEFNPRAVQQHSVGKVHKFANFTRLFNDIALLELNTVIQFTEYVQPACLNREEDITGQQGTVVGWGLTEDDETSPTLRQAQLPVVDTVTCLKSDRVLFGHSLDDGMFCAGHMNGTGVCNGDSGGGLFIKRSNVWYLGGIVSFAKSRLDGDSGFCHRQSYGAFTKVQKYLSWIGDITKMQFKFGAVDSCYPAEEDDSTKTYRYYFPRNCGVYIPTGDRYSIEAKVFEFPWMAILRHDTRGFVCAGTLINKRYVLSAVHCFRGHEYMPNQVRLGEHTIGRDLDCNAGDGDNSTFVSEDCALPVRDYGIICIIRHPAYEFKKRSANIALVRVSEDIIFQDHIQPICLPLTANLRQYQPAKFFTSGWGFHSKSTDDKSSSVLRKGTVTVSDRSLCRDSQSAPIADDQLCVAGGPAFARNCAIDSGGPLGYGGNLHGTRFILFGIYTHTLGIYCSDSPMVYTNVSTHMNWILANMEV
ncbi:serine protease grass-like [Sabethes cyaneus]|uniref:serine protease grass-like n=1 Tax=Sabethes cyaneus TaxID=53552 RepID=UPI00237DEEC8|nr:serine protease grass-like [Sabethes cyaneus]